MRVRLGVDLSLWLGTGLLGLSSEYLLTPRLPVPAGEPPPPRLSGLDRAAFGAWRPEHSTASWITLGVVSLAPFAYHGAEVASFAGPRGRRFAIDALLLGETLTINMLVTEVFKFAVRRPRPYMHLEASEIEDEDAREKLREDQREFDGYKSFVSGHSSIAFAMATSGATLFTAKMMEKERTPGRIAATAGVWAGGLGLAGATAALRVSAGKHYPTDILGGAIVGTSVGLLVPLLHLRPRDEGPTRVRWVLAPRPGGATLSGVF
jgi:membrane-associated phospholipid phosphatase